MTERSDAWYRSLLPAVGALTDTSVAGWTYIALVSRITDVTAANVVESTSGILYDLPSGVAQTRAEALVLGRDQLDTDPAVGAVTVWEEWAYTQEEATAMSFQQGVGGQSSPEVEDDCGCGT